MSGRRPGRHGPPPRSHPMNRQERRSRAHRKARRGSAAEPVLATAIRRHREGDCAGAEAGYLARLGAVPDDPDALHFLGVLRHQQQRTDEAIALVTRALAIAPAYVDAWN